MENTERFEEKARKLAFEHYINSMDFAVAINEEDVKVVWFCKTLKNWKAMVAILVEGGPFYEITYNGHKEESYVDCYVKTENVCVPD